VTGVNRRGDVVGGDYDYDVVGNTVNADATGFYAARWDLATGAVPRFAEGAVTDLNAVNAAGLAGGLAGVPGGLVGGLAGGSGGMLGGADGGGGGEPGPDGVGFTGGGDAGSDGDGSDGDGDGGSDGGGASMSTWNSGRAPRRW
jgi:hypothetical protein